MLQGSKTRFPALPHLAVCSVFGGHEWVGDGVAYRDNGFVLCDNGRGDGRLGAVHVPIVRHAQSPTPPRPAPPLLPGQRFEDISQKVSAFICIITSEQ